MSLGELLRIAFRYTLSAGRGHLSVFMAGVSIGGLVLATGLLLTVLSVMNGFEREMRDRILALVPHVTVHTPPDGGRGYDVEARLDTLPGIRSRQAFVAFEGMLDRGSGTGTGFPAIGHGGRIARRQSAGRGRCPRRFRCRTTRCKGRRYAHASRASERRFPGWPDPFPASASFGDRRYGHRA